MKDKLKLGAAIACGALLLLFAILNRDYVSVSFIFATVTAPLWIVILLAAILGATISFAVRVLRLSKKEKT
ncbi:MAG TPA: lipopolysaccharide assembly protein LapA domain-containing protein [Planctomycetota bacterium]|nr:lipopolysaccharide assembly protein LapA domain-containing protein [Planctomycetota bacterium]